MRDTSTDAKAREVENVFVERRDRDRREEKFEFFFQCNSSFDEWMLMVCVHGGVFFNQASL